MRINTKIINNKKFLFSKSHRKKSFNQEDPEEYFYKSEVTSVKSDDINLEFENINMDEED